MDTMQIPNSNHIFYATEENRLFPTHNNHDTQLTNTPPESSFKELENELMEADEALEELKMVKNERQEENVNVDVDNENNEKEITVDKEVDDGDLNKEEDGISNVNKKEEIGNDKESNNGKENNNDEKVDMNEIIKKNEEQFKKLIQESKLAMIGKENNLEKPKAKNVSQNKVDKYEDKNLLSNSTMITKTIKSSDIKKPVTSVIPKSTTPIAKVNVPNLKVSNPSTKIPTLSKKNVNTNIKQNINLIVNKVNQRHIIKSNLPDKKTITNKPSIIKDDLNHDHVKASKKNGIDKLAPIVPIVKSENKNKSHLRQGNSINYINPSSSHDIHKLIKNHIIKENSNLSSKLVNNEQSDATTVNKDSSSISNLRDSKQISLANNKKLTVIRQIGHVNPNRNNSKQNINFQNDISQVKSIKTISVNGPLDDFSNIEEITPQNFEKYNQNTFSKKNKKISKINSQNKSPFANGPISDTDVPDIPIFLEKKAKALTNYNSVNKNSAKNKKYEYVPFKLNTFLPPKRNLSERERLLQEVDRNNQIIDGILNKQDKIIKYKNISQK
jgi:hypothetical protein